MLLHRERNLLASVHNEGCGLHYQHKALARQPSASRNEECKKVSSSKWPETLNVFLNSPLSPIALCGYKYQLPSNSGKLIHLNHKSL